jgi:iron complex outermembrane receptor protein/vitamin B12 transporter
MSLSRRFENPTSSGMAFDPFGFGANYLGRRVTVTGANGFSTTGQAILEFDGSFPSVFESKSTRRAVYGQLTYQTPSGFAVSGGAHVDREQGFSDPDADPAATRRNGGVWIEGRGTLLRRVTVSAGLGYERNAVFTSAFTPSVSVAAYLRTPSPAGRWGDTRLTFNAGRGVKAPSVFQETSSLFTTLQATEGGAAVAARTGVRPLGPERGRNVDVGLEQGIAGGRARMRIGYFDNEYRDLIEFVSNTVLPRLGVPLEAALAIDFGANVNAGSYRARGVEASVEAAFAPRLRAVASYTYVDAAVTASLSGGVLTPAVNPSFPAIPIGAFTALVGARPFRRPAHSGSFLVSYEQGPAQVALAGYMSGRFDDSTFLSDPFFGDSMLLPNRDLGAGYRKLDLSGSYRLAARARWFASIENLLNERYQPVFGFPALGVTVRSGVSITLGGEVP